jgi:catechol 2,3-dioxygenase-like lactoylglutathione lyase family enzyme
MLAYATLGTDNMPRAMAFYDALFAKLGARRVWSTDRFVAWSTSPTASALAIGRPYDGKPATVGNGVMIALQVDSTAKVDEVHAQALALGAKDEGAPSRRSDDFYAGFFRDLDGNKLNVCFLG